MDRFAMLAELKRLYRGEALFRPSSISRVLKCRGSVQLIARAPRERRSSRYAQEGSGAHIVAAEALRGIRQPDEWTDRMVRLDEGGMEGIFVDAEMVEKVGEYIDEVQSRIAPGMEVFIEHAMSLGAMDPTDSILAENRGTGDVVLLDRPKRRIGIIDLKYGKGVMVAGDSPQLKNYAVQAVVSFADVQWDEIELTVVQPRAAQENQRLKSFGFDPSELLSDFLGELMEAMHLSLEPDPPLVTGAHCQWCPAKDAGICPAVQAEALAIGRDTFADAGRFSALSSMGPIPDAVHVGTIEEPHAPVTWPKATFVVELPPAVALSPGDIATILDRRHLWDMFIQSVEERACALIEAGINVPGWMMGMGRSGNREWALEQKETEDALRAIGIKTIEMYEPSRLLSPAKVERLLKKEKKHLVTVSPGEGNPVLVTRKDGSPVLMRATEGRQRLPAGMGPVASMGAIEKE